MGVDHLIYGWVFFGIVMALLFWVGSRWREDDLPLPASSVAPSTPSRTASPATRAWPMLLAVVALTAIWPTVEAYQERGAKREAFTLPRISANAGWTAASGGLPDWRPDVAGASAELRQTFAKNGRDVGLHIAFFRNQTNDAKAITSINQIVSTSNVLWAQVSTDTIDMTIDGKSFSAQATEIAGTHRRLAVWQWFWVDGHETSSEYLAKFYQVLAVLQGRGDPVAWVIAYTPADNGMAGADVRAAGVRRRHARPDQRVAATSGHSMSMPLAVHRKRRPAPARSRMSSTVSTWEGLKTAWST